MAKKEVTEKAVKEVAKKVEAKVEKELEKTPQQSLQEWLDEETNRKMMVEMAEGLTKIKALGTWFNLIQFTSKTQWKKVEDALHILNLLKMSGLLEARMFGTGKNKVEQYHIKLSKEANILLLKTAIKKHEDEIESLKAKLPGLQTQLAKLEK